MVVETNKLIKCPLSKKYIGSILEQANKIIESKNSPKIISVVVTDEKLIKRINFKYRKINRATDVLSFNDPAEIIICWSWLVRQAKKQKHNAKEEMIILLIHGFLHILGYDHKNKEQADSMEKQSKKIISLLKK